MSTASVVDRPFLVPETMEQTPPSANPGAPRSRKRRPRPTHNRERQQNRPAPSTDEQPHQPQQNAPSVPGPLNDGRPRQRRRGRGGPGKATQPQQAPNGEQSGDTSAPRSRGMRARGFGARLTRPDQVSGEQLQGVEDSEGLRGNAPSFVPGTSASNTRPSPSESGAPSKGKGKSVTKPPPKSPKTKSSAEDIATRTHEDIANNLYECPICTNELSRRTKIWSCELCWTVFHLSCIKKWSTNEGAAAARQPANSDAARAWRCPGCNLSHETFPSGYTCWCEKEVEPKPYPGLPPHSCGQTCSRARKGCPHPCDATCHAGPCAPCTAMGPTQDCYCGRNSSTNRCQTTDYENGWSCGEICGDLLPCGEHTCPLPCHEGLCGACEVKLTVSCYCGKEVSEMMCSSTEEKIQSQLFNEDDGSTREWEGRFSCKTSCNRPLDCGVHSCQKGCHSQHLHPAHCPRSPNVVKRCPCGKTELASIPGFTPRSSCEDPIANCLEACGKMLACGHSCDKICHTGPCGVCRRDVPISCQCGRTTSMTICHQGDIQPPMCFRVCKTNLHCSRHTCSERCCPGETKAIERQALRRKLKAHLRPSDEDFEAEHICTRICGRMLKCGRHTCPELCHKGPCNTCRDAVFEEISCNCGRSVLYPPQPCGTKPPPCSRPCDRPKVCGHPQTAHNCHTDDETCPKCPFLTDKDCLCGKRVMKNVPCWLSDTRCGQICGKPLKCGSHFCKKDCHRLGECEDANKTCEQDCGKNKSLCGHPCTVPCHAPYPCPEKTACSSLIEVACSCGRLHQTRRCNAVKAITSKGQLQQPERLPVLTPLTCDDECTRLERNRSLASALGVNINQATTVQAFTPNNLPYSSETLDHYIKLASMSPLSTLQTYESTLHSLAADPSTRSIRFQPAKATLRAFSHCLAADWGFVTESHDPEPHRHVFVLKPLTWTPPIFGLGSGTQIGIGGMSVRGCVKFRERERTKEREAQRLAAYEAKVARDSAREQSSGDGWAQVASRSKKPGESSTPSTRSSTPMQSSFGSQSRFSALVGGGMPDGATGKKQRLVLRSGVSAGKALRAQPAPEVVESWEEAEEKEEEVEREQERVAHEELQHEELQHEELQHEEIQHEEIQHEEIQHEELQETESGN
ncbi:hypothetical protein N7495_002772 [Penicillium taxi]|uniref:uncharacterized protein n=1 Tax=Penicillium taxi TaxID=168475 RepID=UPI002545AA7A|nr:uncharacterized protein N7495_002772 [Penicillium taxi]KAJ5902244.1 hypothetical protein N7495_002772 [Penicillium taxi]